MSKRAILEQNRIEQNRTDKDKDNCALLAENKYVMISVLCL